MENLDFGKKLIEIRKQRGLTQGEVAEKCNVTTRTIQRIESGTVNPRASTIKIISKALGFDFFETSNTGYVVKKESQTSKLEKHTILWYLKDLFNLKTNAMRKIPILLTSTFLIVFLCINIMNAMAQKNNLKNQKSLIIQLNEDKTVKRVELAFTHNLTSDSIAQIKKDLKDIVIDLIVTRLSLDDKDQLLGLECEINCNDGFSGSLSVSELDTRFLNKRVGFFRHYDPPKGKSPFGTGMLDKE